MKPRNKTENAFSKKIIVQQVSTAVVVASLERQAAPSMRKISALKILTKDDFETAAETINKLKDLVAEADKQEKSIIAPMRTAIKAAQAHFKPFKDKVAEIEASTKVVMLEFLEKLKKISAKVEADFEAGKIKKVGTVVGRLADLRIDNGAAQVRKVWKLFIDDPIAVPKQFLIPDEAAIKEAFQNGTLVRGCRFEQVNSIAI